jgi:PBP1b-binding outer membrane lipoprotein LpoB
MAILVASCSQYKPSTSYTASRKVLEKSVDRNIKLIANEESVIDSVISKHPERNT